MFLQLYYAAMTAGGLTMAITMARFLQLFTPPVRGWWILATSQRLLTGSLMAQGVRIFVIYGFRLLGYELALFDRILSGALTLVSVVSCVFFLKGYLKYREFGPGAGRANKRERVEGGA
jgi:hypothetical protein